MTKFHVIKMLMEFYCGIVRWKKMLGIIYWLFVAQALLIIKGVPKKPRGKVFSRAFCCDPYILSLRSYMKKFCHLLGYASSYTVVTNDW